MWRPDRWVNPYKDSGFSDEEIAIFEAGADAILKALWKLAEESPTKEFTFDSRFVGVYTLLPNAICTYLDGQPLIKRVKE